MNKDSLCSTCAPVIGRVLLSVIFIMSGVNKIMNWDGTAEKMTGEGMVLVPLLLVGAIVFEIAGGLSVLIGCWPRLGSTLLIVFLIPTTLSPSAPSSGQAISGMRRSVSGNEGRQGFRKTGRHAWRVSLRSRFATEQGMRI